MVYYPLAIEHEKNIIYDFFDFDVYVTDNRFFQVKEMNLTPGFFNLKNREDCLRLERNPLSFYQNQFNMAVWFATAGCGVSINDHLKNSIPMIRSFYRFHAYYQVCKILKNLQVPIPGESNFNETNNNINRGKLGELLSEFGLKNEYDFSVFSTNGGWAAWSVPDYNPNITDPGYYINDSKINFFLMQVHENKTPPMFSVDWDEGMANFKYPDSFIKYHVNHRHKNVFEVIKQNPCQTYQQFMIRKSSGFSNPGIERLNDSIRTYVYCVLGAQSMTRTPITGRPGTELDAQKEFIKLLKDSVNQHADIPTSILRYQKAIAETHTRLDYVIAPGLYIIGSDMVLKIGSIMNFNNNILLATSEMRPGRNEINGKKNTAPPLMKGPPVKTYKMKTTDTSPETATKITEPAGGPESPVQPTVQPNIAAEADTTHENIKFILVAVTGGIVSLIWYFN